MGATSDAEAGGPMAEIPGGDARQSTAETRRQVAPQAPNPRLPFRVAMMIGFAWMVLLLERLAAAMIPAFAVLALFVAVAALGVPRELPVWAHVLLLAVFAAGFLFALYRGCRGFRWPNRRGALRRLELDSKLDHRPLTHIDDVPVGIADPAAQNLWHRHRQRLLAAIGRLDLGGPDTGMARRDPFALRHAALLLALVGIVVAGSAWQRRLDLALLPNFSGIEAGEQITIEAWITPPDYTGLPPISLSYDPNRADADATKPLEVPVGSKLLLQAQGLPTDGLTGPATLLANEESIAFDVLDITTQRAEMVLEKGNMIGVQSGLGTVAEWPVRLLPDMAPIPHFGGDPTVTERGVLRLAYEAKDDYGVTDLRLVVSRGSETLELKLPLGRMGEAEGGGRVARGAAYQDLTAHPWAGLDVEMRLVARDALGQIGASAPLALTLPERKFFHPVARAIAEERKRLAADWQIRKEVARELKMLKAQPEAYEGNIAAFLGMDAASRRLTRQPFEASDLPPILRLMWDTALDIEDGGTSIALQEFRRLQQELMEALERGASDEEIERLMNQLQEAMNRYMQDMMRQLQRAMENGVPLQRLSPNGLQLSQRDLNQMLQDAKRMAQSGAKDSAREMLEQLQRMMENLQAGVPPMMSPDGQQGQQLANELARMMQRQQELLQQSFDAQRGQQPGQQDGMGEGEMDGMPGEGRGAGTGAMGQEQLRRDLGNLMRQMGQAFGDLPQGLGAAEQAMRDAVDALGKPDFGGAADAQNEALNQLQQGLQSAQQMMQRQMGLREGPGQRDQMDPLGRTVKGAEDGATGNAVDTDGGRDVDISSDPLQRARQIFDELRQRRNDPSRPKQERDYLDRLLKQF
jgi:uncharacterized protein (TIGR02302 family)